MSSPSSARPSSKDSTFVPFVQRSFCIFVIWELNIETHIAIASMLETACRIMTAYPTFRPILLNFLLPLPIGTRTSSIFFLLAFQKISILYYSIGPEILEASFTVLTPVSAFIRPILCSPLCTGRCNF